MNPALLYTPKRAGWVAVASIRIACKTQRMKLAILWLPNAKTTIQGMAGLSLSLCDTGMESRRVALSINSAAVKEPRRQPLAITRSLAKPIHTGSGGGAAAVHPCAYQLDVGGNKLDDTGGMGGRAL